ncbi:MAG: hypothetical protein ACI8XO_002445 [Verrucomicrobiales bacterium]|jgi:hypothetical protein
MNVAVVEGIVGLGSGGKAARFCRGREMMDVVIRSRLGCGISRVTIVVTGITDAVLVSCRGR